MPRKKAVAAAVAAPVDPSDLNARIAQLEM